MPEQLFKKLSFSWLLITTTQLRCHIWLHERSLFKSKLTIESGLKLLIKVNLINFTVKQYKSAYKDRIGGHC